MTTLAITLGTTNPTEHLTNLEPYSPSIFELYVVEERRPTDLHSIGSRVLGLLEHDVIGHVYLLNLLC